MADPQGIHVDKDGTVRIVLDDQTITIRRATLREYTDFLDLARKADDEVRELAKQLDGADTDRQREVLDQVALLRRPVLERLFSDFGGIDVEGFDWDAVPPWLAKRPADVIGHVLQAWETVPFHGSGRSVS